MKRIIVAILVVIAYLSVSSRAQITVESPGQAVRLERKRPRLLCRASKPIAASEDACAPVLPTGVSLDPAARSFATGNMPLAMIVSPEGDRLIVSLSGWRQQGLQVIDRHTGEIVQTISQPGAFLGLAFSKDGRTLFASGGNEDAIYRYAWHEKQASLIDTIALAPKEPKKDGTRFPAGLALSPNGKHLYVAENIADSLAVIDVETGKVLQRFPTEAYPYDVVVAPAGGVYVSAWGGDTVSTFHPDKEGLLRERGRIPVGR